MIEKSSKKQKKGSISEADVASLLKKYTPTTVLKLLHEVANSADANIDWNALVEKTSTGISNAREYQTLWRHLAYRHSLLEKFEDGAQPLDDDSDLEYELEAVPAVNNESSTEAAACVKVLIASGIASGSNPSGSTIEAPLTINIPNGQPSRALERPSCSTQGTNITIPVSVQKQPTPAATVAESLDTNGSNGGNLLKRRRKPWSEAEDLELIAAVQKCGEGNWANILRGDFKGDRTASQLSQRWAIIRKRHGNLNLGGNSNGSPQLSEAQLAARYAMSLALNMPVKNLTANTMSHAGTNSTNRSAGTNATNNSRLTPAVEASTSGNSSLQSQKKSHENLAAKQSPVGSLGPTTKSRLPLKKPVVKPLPSSDAMVRATAVAAGARIASPSDAALLRKAAQSKNAVHIMPKGGSSIKSSITSGMPASSDAHPNVHYIRTGLGPPVSTYAAATPSAPCPGSIKAISPPTTSNGTSLEGSSKQKNDVSCTPAQELPGKQEPKTIEEIKVEPGSATKEQIQVDGVFFPANSKGELVQDNKVAASDPNAELKYTSAVGKPVSSSNERTAEHDQVTVDVQPKDSESETGNENREENIDKMQEDDAVGESHEPQNIDEMEEDHAAEENGEAQKTDKMQEDHAIEENGEAQKTDKMQEDHAAEENGDARPAGKMQDDRVVEENDQARNTNKMQEDHAVEAQSVNKMHEDRAVEETGEAQNKDKMQEDLPSTRVDGCSVKSENKCE